MPDITEFNLSDSRQLVSPQMALLDAIDAIGHEQFGAKLLNYLHAVCGADHCAVFHLGADSVSRLASGSLDGTDMAERQAKLYTTQHHWRNDPIMHEAREQLSYSGFSIVHGNLREMADTQLRKAIYPSVNERVVICGKKDEIALGLSVLRSDTRLRFSDEELAKLNESAELLMSLLAKHAAVLLSRPNVVRAITCLDEIEDCLMTMTQFPKRELEVCARIIHGLSSVGIALDLGVGEETVRTYRKRSYLRLNIGSERELLTWYLDLWSTWRGLSYRGSVRFNAGVGEKEKSLASGSGLN